MLTKMFNTVLLHSANARRLRSRLWYEYVSRKLRRAAVLFLNYGYVELGPLPNKLELLPEDETDRLSIQLYHHVAGAVELRGLDLLEVGCGRGGGSSYIRRYLKPNSVTGIDLAQEAIDFCQSYYKLDGLRFFDGDAERLEFADESFDAVVNLESSHCYGDVDKFLSEVRRVLRPGGYFLFADLRLSEGLPLLESQLKNSGLEILKTQFITANVVKAMGLESEKKSSLIERFAPRLMQPFGRIFAGVKGSSTLTTLASGERVYKSFVLRKPRK